MANNMDVRVGALAKKCKKCKMVPLSGLKCVNCGVLMHPGCIKYYPEIVKLSETTIKCCEPNQDNEQSEDDLNMTVRSIEKEQENVVLDDVLKENIRLSNENELLRRLINEMEEKNKLLYYKINVLEGSGSVKTKAIIGNQEHLDTQTPTPPSTTSTQGHRQAANLNSYASRIRQSQNTTSSAPNYNNQSPRNTVIQPISAAKPNSNNNSDTGKQISQNIVIVGSAPSHDNGSGDENMLRAAESNIFQMHVSNLDCKTTGEQLSNYIKRVLSVECISVEALKTNGLYSSFKVSIPKEADVKVLQPDLWPIGVKVRKFIPRKPFFRDAQFSSRYQNQKHFNRGYNKR